MLNNGQNFPPLELQAVGGGAINLPQDLAGSFGVVLAYRGAWCPLCVKQLADFAGVAAELQGLGIKVVAFSVDDEATTKGLAGKLHISYPLGHSADAGQVVAALGSFTNEQPHYIQPTGFILGPDGVVLNALYSTNAMGRFTSAEVKTLVAYIRSKQAKAA